MAATAGRFTRCRTTGWLPKRARSRQILTGDRTKRRSDPTCTTHRCRQFEYGARYRKRLEVGRLLRSVKAVSAPRIMSYLKAEMGKYVGEQEAQPPMNLVQVPQMDSMPIEPGGAE